MTYYQTRVLVVDDERSVREMISILLKRSGHEVVTASSGDQATKLLEAGERYDIVITDLAMDRGGGMKVLSQVKSRDQHCPVIMVTAFGTTESAVEAMKNGAYDYISKPFNVDEFQLIIDQAMEHRTLVRENITLRAKIKGKYRFDNVIGRSSAMQRVLDICRKVADTNATVLISGESGVGKEIVARAIHFESRHSNNKFIAVNCGALPESLMESEMFGHTKGAFTGAVSDKEGLFKTADGGTIFLDEIGELAPSLQVKLLRVLQERTIRPVGSSKEIPINVRILSATNVSLEDLIENNLFRTDLYYRLNVINVVIPPLRERQGDIADLIQEFFPALIAQTNNRIQGLSPETMRILMEYDYPGNVRELKNILERAITLASGTQIETCDLPPKLISNNRSITASTTKLPDEGIDLDNMLYLLETNMVTQALAKTDGSQKQASKLLGITVRSLRYRLAKKPDNQNGDIK